MSEQNTGPSAFSLGKKILSAFVVLDNTPAPVSQHSTAPPTLSKPPAFAPTYAGADQGMVDALQKVVVSKKTAYTALLESSERLRGVIPDDIMRLRAAFATISAEGMRTPQSISDAIDVHINDINGELMRFKQTSDTAVASKVGVTRSTIANIASSNTGRAQTIANLQSQIASLQQSITTDTATATDLTNQADATEAEINATTVRFTTAVDFVKQDLTNKKSQLASTLTA
jgi:chromosome segregation ATPase